MFGGITGRYDLINHIFTWGMDNKWRRRLAAACLESGPQRVLDIGCGTGDLTIAIARRAGPGTGVTGFDFSQPMLAEAARKAGKALLDNTITFTQGEVSSMPFPNGHFDSIGISFAFRNLIYKNPLAEQHLAEIFRVLKPGGRFLIAESSQPRNKVIRWLDHLYIRTFVYWMGRLISGDKGAYKYLAESAANFYGPDELEKILKEAGFREVIYRPFFLGAAGLYRVTR
jgi:demethylmenaquinone methyltransferase/2-methoxy-6-polyprenyl-1,4-benzoquinol methylase